MDDSHEAQGGLVGEERVLGRIREALGAGAPELERVQVRAGELLFAQGDEADSVYVLLAGALGVRVAQPDGPEQEIDRLTPGATVGELALLSGRRRTASVYALEDAALARLSRADWEQLPEESRVALAGSMVVERWQRLQLTDVLRGLFGEMDAGTLRLLQGQLEWRHLSNGDVLFRQGAASDGMYLVVNGRLRFTVADGEGGESLSGEIGRGEPVGEFALITDDVRSATVHAVRETDVVRMSREMFERAVEAYPAFMGRMTRVIVERQQRLVTKQRPTGQRNLTLAVLPAQAGVDAAAFARELAESMGRFGSALALDGEGFDREYGREGASASEPDDPSTAGIVSWLGEMEAGHSYLIFAGAYEQGPEISAWTQRCIGRADRVLIVADPREGPTPGAAEEMVSRMETPLRTELVLWHPADTVRPQGTAAWLEARNGLHAHHHVRMGDRGHMDRLARRLTGNAVALVLSGGSARGFAHMGVHRAMEELGIPIDYVGGTSMGAVMGGTMVTRESNAELVAVAREVADPKNIFDRTLPITSVMASKKVTRLMQQVFGEAQIEDQWIPFYCVAANLTTAEPVVFRRGALWRAVRMSLSIPAVFAPVIADGDVVVDGGVMDNFPTQVMAGVCESVRIVGVNVSPFREKKRYYDFETDVSGWRVLLSRLNPFAKSLRTPSLIGTVVRTMEINSIRRSKESEAVVDVLIQPDVKQFGSTEYDRYEELSRAGYEAALEPLRAWKAGMGW